MRFTRWSYLLLPALALSAAANAQGAFDIYRLTHIGEAFGLDDVRTEDINEAGEMAGQGISGQLARAILLRDGMVIEVGDLLGGASPDAGAVAINDLTQIAGFSDELNASGAQVRRGFIWHAGQIRALGIDPEDPTFFPGMVIPRDINNRGQIVGNKNASPFLWEDGRTTLLELLEPPVTECPPTLPQGEARAINESGVIVGHSRGISGQRAVMWRNGEITVLEPTIPAATGAAMDVNDRNEVIGAYWNQAPLHQTAYLWRDGVVAAVLPPLSGPANPLSINNQGQIVGATELGDRQLATLWQDGAVVDLNTLISDDDPLKGSVTLSFGYRITDSGLIIALGTGNDWYLLTPIGLCASPATVSPATDSPPPSSSDTGSGSSDTGSGGGALDLVSLLALLLGLSALRADRTWRRVPRQPRRR